MSFKGANSDAQVEGADPLPGKVNYLIGNKQEDWHTDISTYAKVLYREIYPGIDLVFHGGQSQLEYDFVVAPGAGPRMIQLNFDGADHARLTKNGDLELSTRAGKIIQHKPVIYQQEGTKKHLIKGGYQLRGNTSVSFLIGDYDHSKPLIIDPTIVYSTVFSGTNGDEGRGVAIDGNGSAYVVGQTYSPDFTVVNPFQGRNGSADAFVSKLSADGAALIYSTYIGGTNGGSYYGVTDGAAIAVDKDGYAYITGNTNTSDFPISQNAYQKAIADGGDAFVMKLRSDGAGFIYSTFLGGHSSSIFGDYGKGIAIDSTGNAYVVGLTGSQDFPTTAEAFEANKKSPELDGFISKLNGDGSTLIYSSYLGGSSSDGANAVAVDGSGNAYVTGYTLSSDFPTANAFQNSYGGPSDSAGEEGDAFVSKVSSDGHTLLYSTYLGGDQGDYGNGIAVDSGGNAYVTGNTSSINFPTTAVSLKPTVAQRVQTVFVTKISSAGSLVYSTYLGNQSVVKSNAIAVDSSGNAYVTGQAGQDFPQVSAVQSQFGGTWDAFIAKLNSAGNTLVYSSFLGGGFIEEGYGVAVDSSGNAYVAGTTKSNDFPRTKLIGDAFVYPNGKIFVSKIGPAAAPPSQKVFSISAITPNRGGDTGIVTTKITGQLFDPAATVKLSRSGESDILPIAVSLKETDGYSVMFANFDLRGKSLGAWDVIVTNADQKSVTLQQGFTIEAGNAPQVWADVMGSPKLRGGREQTYHLFFGNRGNTDAYGVFVSIAFPKFMSWKLATVIEQPTNIPYFGDVDLSQYPYWTETSDTIIIPFFIRQLPASSSQSIQIKLTAPDDPQYAHSYHNLTASISEPLFTLAPQNSSSATANRLGAASIGNTFCNLVANHNLDSDCITAILNTILNALGIAPTVGCGITVVQVILNYLTTLVGICQTDPASANHPLFATNLLLTIIGNVVSIGSNCFKSIIPVVGQIVGFIQTLWAGVQAVPPCLDRFFPATTTVEIVTSGDPNDKFGPHGYGDQQYISTAQPLVYGIEFQNKPDATAPAQVVTVSDQLDPSKLDLNSFSFNLITFGDHVVTPPPGISDFSTDVDLRPGKNLLVRINAHLDKSTGLLTWTFTSIEPNTGQPPNDPLAGFLPQDVNPPEGEGSVLFTVKPLVTLATNTQVTNQARIIFDSNPFIDTPQWLNTIDNSKPQSRVSQLPATTCNNFTVNWSGTDTGSGIQSYTIYVSKNGGEYSPWLSNTTQISATFSGELGQTYAFYSVARDNAGNVEDIHSSFDTTTHINTPTPPVFTNVPSNLTLYTGSNSASCAVFVSDSALGTALAQASCSSVSVKRSGVPAGNLFPVGTTKISYTATDASGDTATATQTITVIDNSPPAISNASLSQTVIWPPNQKMVTVTVNYTTTDNCSGTVTAKISSITSNEPIKASDAVIVDTHHVSLRADRLGTGKGRVYSIVITATDSHGNSSNKTLTVNVPHDQGR